MTKANQQAGDSLLSRLYKTVMYPEICQACDKRIVKGEIDICHPCRIALPQTNFHLRKHNLIEQEFAGRIKLERAAAFLYFNKGSKVQQLMWRLKYKGQQSVGIRLGQLYGEQLLKSDFLKGIDLILTVPLHERKRSEREFNQADLFAEGLSEVCNIPWSGELIERMEFTETQTKKSRAERWENVSGKFNVLQPALLADKHILLVDDVVTTGTTLEACGQSILQIPNTKLSIATAATAIQL